MHLRAGTPHENRKRAVVGHLQQQKAFRGIGVLVQPKTSSQELRHLSLIVVVLVVDKDHQAGIRVLSEGWSGQSPSEQRL